VNPIAVQELTAITKARELGGKVFAVTSGVVVTVLCLRKREKKKTESKNSEHKGDAEQR